MVGDHTCIALFLGSPCFSTDLIGLPSCQYYTVLIITFVIQFVSNTECDDFSDVLFKDYFGYSVSFGNPHLRIPCSSAMKNAFRILIGIH